MLVILLITFEASSCRVSAGGNLFVIDKSMLFDNNSDNIRD